MLNIAVLLIAVLVVAGAAALQIYLSTRKNKWLGLIIPIFFIVLSALGVLDIANTGSAQENMGLIVQTALIGNIPTVITLVIYFICRKKQRRYA
jgi:hypothetical protein